MRNALLDLTTIVPVIAYHRRSYAERYSRFSVSSGWAEESTPKTSHRPRKKGAESMLHVPNRASKGKTGGRTIPLHPDLQAALVALQTRRGDMATPERPILFSERGGGLSPAT